MLRRLGRYLGSMPSIASAADAPRPPIETGTWPKAPFPNIKTHPLLVVDFAKIAQGDESEANTLFTACKTLGFFYLKNYGFEDLIEPMFRVGEETFRLPLQELLKFEQGDSGRTCGFKRAGGSNVDAKGNLDTVEFMNISKDDALAYPEPRQRTYPEPVNRNMSTITDFVTSSDTVLKTLLAVLEPRVGLEPGLLQKLHANGPPHLSGSEARLIYKPFSGAPGALKEGVGEDGKPAAAIGSHTDFGSCMSGTNWKVDGRNIETDSHSNICTFLQSQCCMVEAAEVCRFYHLVPTNGNSSSRFQDMQFAMSATLYVSLRKGQASSYVCSDL